MMSIPISSMMSIPFDNMSGPIPRSVPFLIFLVMSVNVETILLGGGQKPLLKPRQMQASMQATATDDSDGWSDPSWSRV